MLNQREMNILKYLIKKPSSRYKELAEVFQISERTIRYNVDKINLFLKKNNIEEIKIKNGNLHFNIEQELSGINSLLNNSYILNQKERTEILKLLFCFSRDINLTKAADYLKVSRTTIKSDFEVLKSDIKNMTLGIKYRQNIGFYISGNKKYIRSFKMETFSRFIPIYIKELYLSNFDKIIYDLFQKNLPTEKGQQINSFIQELEKNLELNLSNNSYEILYSLILCFFVNDKSSTTLKQNDYDSVNNFFLENTKEYAIIKDITKNFSDLIGIKFSKYRIIEITDYILGITLCNFDVSLVNNWINVEFLVQNLIANFNKYLEMDISGDKTLFNCLLYHIKPTLYRINKKIKLENTAFRELIINQDPTLEIVKKAVNDMEKALNIEFTEEELALLAYHFKASVERNTYIYPKKVLLVCGLGYGSSRLLEQNLKEHYNLDIVDVLPYHQLDEALKNYSSVELIFTTINIKNNYGIPVIKINPLLKKEDMEEIEKFHIQKNDNKISLTNLIDTIENNISLNNEDKEKLIAGIREDFSHKIIDDSDIKTENFGHLINENNIQILEKLDSWSDAIRISGEMLIKQNCVTENYIGEMKELVKKFGSYIVVADGIAIPHGAIGKNVINDGAALLILKEAVKFDDGEMVNIFIPFATRGKKFHSKLLNEIFSIIKKKGIKDKILSLKTEEKILEYLNH
jgi:mannitol operon transcriptional antiterminator